MSKSSAFRSPLAAQRHQPAVLWACLVLCAGCSATGQSDAATDTIDGATADGAADDGGGGDGAAWSEDGDHGDWRVALAEEALTTDAQGFTPPLAFDVPPGTSHVFVSVRGAADAHYTLGSLRRPDGFTLVPPAWTEIESPTRCQESCATPLVATSGHAAFLIPNATGITADAGRWQVQAFAFTRAGAQTAASPQRAVTVRVEAVRKGTERLARGKLAVNLCYTGAYGVTAAIGPEHPRVTAAVATLRALFDQAGIDVDVAHHDVADAPLVVRSQHGSDSDLATLFGSGASLPSGLNVFLVDRVELDQGGGLGPGVVLGISGGIPGPASAQRGVRSGVALTWQPQAGDDVLGVVLAHEIAHYLGLLHASEVPPVQGKRVHDKLVDTPKGSSDNLMLYTPGLSTTELSLEQRLVMHGHPLVWPSSEQAPP